MVITMQFSELGPAPHLAHVASLRSQFMETEAFHTLLTEGLYENGSDSGDGYNQGAGGSFFMLQGGLDKIIIREILSSLAVLDKSIRQ